MADERGTLAYLVRLWSVHHDGDLLWRASAENAHTSERHALANIVSHVSPRSFIKRMHFRHAGIPIQGQVYAAAI